MLLNTLVQMGRDQDRLRKMKSQVEDCFTKFIFANISAFSRAQRDRIAEFLGSYIAQSSGRDIGSAESFLLKLTEGTLQSE